MQSAIAAPRDDIDVLNYALTLEHLEYAFYRDGLRRFGNQVPRLFFDIRDHEHAHVDTLIGIIRNLGGRPVQEGCYDFNFDQGVRVFKETAQALENTGVRAYDGAISSITTPRLQTAGATIATVEARHAAYLNTINGDSPFPDAFDKPLTKQQVLDIAGQFIVDCR